MLRAVTAMETAAAKRLSAGGTDATMATSGSFLIMMVVMIVIMYFLIWRPESKRKKEAEAMRNSLKKGDKITTIGGIMGKIVQVTDETVVLETGEDRVRVELAKWAVSTNNSQQPADTKKGKKSKTAAAGEDAPRLEDGGEN